MRSLRFLSLAVVCAALPLFARNAPTVSSVSPGTLKMQSGEWFVTLQGTNYLPTAGVTVIFSGPAGTISLKPNASTDSNMTVWVPQEVLLSPGSYSVTVRVPNGAGTLDSNAGTLVVTGKWLIIKIPNFVFAEAIDLTGGPARFSVSATSFESDQVTIDCSAKSGDFFKFDTTTVDCTASDDMGNSDRGSFSVQVADTTPPAIEFATKDLLAFGKSDGGVVAYDVKVSDVVDPDVKVDCAPASGSFFRVGTSSVTCSSTDRFKNTGTASFRVHLGTDDIPAMVLPSDLSVEAESLDGAVVKYDASATTVDGKAAEIKCDPPAGSVFKTGTTTVKCIAWGPSGASTTDFFNVTVADTTAPVLSLPADITVQAPSAAGATVDYRVTATDAVDGAVSVACSPAAGSLFAPGQTVVNCTASDRSKNNANGTFLVNVLPWFDDTVYAMPGTSSSDQ